MPMRRQCSVMRIVWDATRGSIPGTPSIRLRVAAWSNWPRPGAPDCFIVLLQTDLEKNSHKKAQNSQTHFVNFVLFCGHSSLTRTGDPFKYLGDQQSLLRSR